MELGFKRGFWRRMGAFHPGSLKARELLVVLLQPLPFLGSPSDAEHKGIC